MSSGVRTPFLFENCTDHFQACTRSSSAACSATILWLDPPSFLFQRFVRRLGVHTMETMWSMRTGNWASKLPLWEVNNPCTLCASKRANLEPGIVLGGFVTGFATQRWGRQICIFFAYFLTIGGVFMQYFSSTPAEYFGAKILTGIPLGCFTTVAPTYASEIAPLAIRGALTSGMNFSIVLGQLIGFGVMRQTTLGQYPGPMSYRILFAVQWGFAAVGLSFLPFFPE